MRTIPALVWIAVTISRAVAGVLSARLKIADEYSDSWVIDVEFHVHSTIKEATEMNNDCGARVVHIVIRLDRYRLELEAAAYIDTIASIQVFAGTLSHLRTVTVETIDEMPKPEVLEGKLTILTSSSPFRRRT